MLNVKATVTMMQERLFIGPTSTVPPHFLEGERLGCHLRGNKTGCPTHTTFRFVARPAADDEGVAIEVVEGMQEVGV